jgi:hypothetical protein
MKDKTPICSRCGRECKEQTHADPTWYARYQNEHRKEVICVECWNKGERWDKKNK